MNRHPTEPTRADLAYAVVYAGAIGSAVIAILFLVLDTLSGRPLETPVLMGSALFLGELPGSADSLRLDLAAAYSVLHFVLFGIVGGVFAVVALRLRGLRFLPLILGVGLFLTMCAGLLLLDALVAPALLEAVGVLPVILGNVFAAGGMVAFYVQALDIGDARLPVPSTLIGDSE